MEIRNLREDEIGAYAELYNKAEFEDPEFRPMDEAEMRKRITIK